MAETGWLHSTIVRWDPVEAALEGKEYCNPGHFVGHAADLYNVQ